MDKKNVYNVLAMSYYLFVPNINGTWETLLGISHGCKVLTLSKIKPFDTNFFTLKENETIYTLKKYKEWVEVIRREWNCKTDIDYKKQIQKIIQTNSLRNTANKWKTVC